MMKFNRNKGIALILILSFLLSLVACGDRKKSDDPTPSNGETVTEPEPITLPDDLAVLRENVTLIVSNEANQLSGTSFVTLFSNMIISGGATEYKDIRL